MSAFWYLNDDKDCPLHPLAGPSAKSPPPEIHLDELVQVIFKELVRTNESIKVGCCVMSPYLQSKMIAWKVRDAVRGKVIVG